MYFINPFYEPPILTSSEKHQKTMQISEILSLSKHQRTASDKRKVYEYFITHPFLRQIQRSKSLRARILCVAQIQLITQTRYAEDFQKNQNTSSQPKKVHSLNVLNTTQKYIVLQKLPSTDTLAVLDSSIVSQILTQDEEPFKHKMNELKKFSFLKQFDYHELLYLSHFVQKTKGFAYKQFVFKQEEPAHCVYFIEEGEFHVFKNIKLLKQKSQTRINQKKQMTPFQKYLGKQESPYKVKEVKLKREEVSKIEGGCGQSFGQLELFLQSQVRLNSLRCNSLTSKLYQIPFSAFQEVFQNLETKFKNLKKKYLEKNEQSTHKVRKIKSLKQNGIKKGQITFQFDAATIENKKLSEMIFEMDKYKSLQSQHLEGSFTLPNNSLTIPINELGQDINRKISIKHYTSSSINKRYDQGHFSSLSNSTQDYSKSIDLKVPSFDTPFFPVIQKSHTQKREENRDNPPLAYSIAKRRNKIKGLMDISSIIKEKQDLYNSLSGVENPEFSFYKLDQKNTKRINYKMAQLNKIQLKDSSPVHSENFMQDLVKKSLKKSGYIQQSSLKNCQTKRTLEDMSRLKTIEKVSSFSLYKEKENQSQTHRQQPEGLNFVVTKEFRASLVSNEFDNFFSKI